MPPPTACLARCYTTNVNYEFYCRRCDAKIVEREEERRGRVAGRGGEEGQEEGQEGQDDEELDEKKPRLTYRGESSRTSYTRAQSHFTNYLTGKESFMYDHTVKEHDGEVRGGQEDYEPLWS